MGKMEAMPEQFLQVGQYLGACLGVASRDGVVVLVVGRSLDLNGDVTGFIIDAKRIDAEIVCEDEQDVRFFGCQGGDLLLRQPYVVDLQVFDLSGKVVNAGAA